MHGKKRTPGVEEFKCTQPHISIEELKIIFQDRVSGTPFRLESKCFHGAYLDTIDLTNLPVQGLCFFGTTILNGKFGDSDLGGSDFRKAKLTNCDFQNANLSNTDFTGSQLMCVDFSNANLLRAILDDVELDGVIFHNTHVASDSFGKMIVAERNGEFLKAHEIYHALRQNFEQVGDYDSASWAYYRERICKYKSHGLKFARKYYGGFGSDAIETFDFFKDGIFWLRNKSWFRWLTGFLQNALWGFAQKPVRVLFWGAGVVFLFSFIYWYWGLVCSGSDTCWEANITTSWMNCLLFSLAAFSTSSVPNLIGASWLANTLASIQGILGVTVLALFTTSLSSKLGGA